MEQFKPVFLEEVVGDRFGRYSKYIIQDRAIPDVRDGLKPVQRRILYAMYEAGNTADKPYRKAAKTVGDVMGNYHPHGDSSIYEGMVRMAQPWKMAHPLIDGHGNWGSLDDDPAAAMRYTEARLSPIALELMRDIEKGTVIFKDNFDNTVQEPSVLPARFPNLLVNGVSGISAGFATEIPTHNLREVIDASIALMEKPDISLDDLMKWIQGPDFPTGGIIMGEKGIKDAYETGKGRIYLKAKTQIEDMRGGKKQIVITEIPYQVVKSKLVTAMENIRLERKVEGIAEVRDESGRDGLRIVIELRKDADAEGIFAYLLKKTDLQITYHFNMVAIVNKTPKQLGLKPLLEAYIAHQKEVVTKRTEHDLNKAEDRAHVVAGLVKALSILDDVIETIKASKNRQDAGQNLISKFGFTERQAESILLLQLYRLTNLEITSLEKERADLLKQIDSLQEILRNPQKLISVIKQELKSIRKTYGIDRRSDIQSNVDELKVNLEVLVSPEDVWVTLSQEGYIKRTSQLSFQRSGADLESTGLKDGDRLRYGFEVNTLDQLLIFTEQGKYFALPVHQIPEFKWKETGTALVNVLPITKEERIIQVLPVKSFADEDKSLLFVTRGGQVKRTALKAYETSRSMAIVACKLQEGDRLLEVMPSEGQDNVMLVTKQGMSIRFAETNINAMGRNSAGVRGIQLKDDDEVVGAMLIHPDAGGELFVLTEKGYGKKTKLTEHAIQNRGGKGIQCFEFKTGKRVRSNGEWLVLAHAPVKPDERWEVVKQNDEVVTLSAEQIPLEERRSTGKQVVPTKKDAYIEHVTLCPSVLDDTKHNDA